MCKNLVDNTLKLQIQYWLTWTRVNFFIRTSQTPNVLIVQLLRLDAETLCMRFWKQNKIVSSTFGGIVFEFRPVENYNESKNSEKLGFIGIKKNVRKLLVKLSFSPLWLTRLKIFFQIWRQNIHFPEHFHPFKIFKWFHILNR